MTRGVKWSLVNLVVLVALIALAGCSHYLLAEREPWRHEAELSCLNSGAVKESPGRVRISSIRGPGVCGADYPLRVSTLGESGPLGYTDESLRPPGTVPAASVPQHWPVVQSGPLPPPQIGQPMPLYPSDLPESEDAATNIPGGPPHPYYGAPNYAPPVSAYPPRQGSARRNVAQPLPPLGPPGAPMVTGSAGPVEVKPAATLACPIVSMLDQWIDAAVQPAALRWFRQPVVEIKQISAYSCRGMNGNPNAHISEHAFGNALNVAEFLLADGRKISVQYGWHGTPEEQGFLHDVQAAACEDFTTVLAPGANVYHYNHIHVDLMRHARGRHICEPAAMSGEAAAASARAHYAAQHGGDPSATGSIVKRAYRRVLGYAGEDTSKMPLAVPGDD